MKDVAVKILSHLSKNTLATLVVILAGFVGRYWYNDYTSRQDYMTSKLIELTQGQIKLGDKIVNESDRTTNELKGIKDEMVLIKGRQDIMIKALPVINTQIRDFEDLFNQVRPQTSIETMQPKELSMITPPEPDSVKKKQLTSMTN